MLQLRADEGSVASNRVAVKAQLEKKASNKTVRRELKRNGYAFLTTWRKGLLSAKDFEKRLTFCRQVKLHKLEKYFWTNRISFYLDATGFQFKTSPLDAAKAPKAREWSKRSEGLIMTAKGKKEGVVNSNFMVGISYNKGVVLCVNYAGAITGAKVAEMAKSAFPRAFKSSIAPRKKRILMDGCPRQNSKIAKQAYDKVHAKIMVIPPRSPDLNPIEIFFNSVKRELKLQAIEQNITRENLTEFNTRVIKTLKNFPIKTINKTIASMDERILQVVDAGGRRIKY